MQLPIRRARFPLCNRRSARWAHQAKDLTAELPELKVVWCLVLRMVLEARTLEILHRVRLPVAQPLGDHLGERVTELRQPAVRFPVPLEAAGDLVPGLGEVARAGIGAHGGAA